MTWAPSWQYMRSTTLNQTTQKTWKGEMMRWDGEMMSIRSPVLMMWGTQYRMIPCWPQFPSSKSSQSRQKNEVVQPVRTATRDRPSISITPTKPPRFPSGPVIGYCPRFPLRFARRELAGLCVRWLHLALSGSNQTLWLVRLFSVVWFQPIISHGPRHCTARIIGWLRSDHKVEGKKE